MVFLLRASQCFYFVKAIINFPIQRLRLSPWPVLHKWTVKKKVFLKACATLMFTVLIESKGISGAYRDSLTFCKCSFFFNEMWANHKGSLFSSIWGTSKSPLALSHAWFLNNKCSTRGRGEWRVVDKTQLQFFFITLIISNCHWKIFVNLPQKTRRLEQIWILAEENTLSGKFCNAKPSGREKSSKKVYVSQAGRLWQWL